MNTSSPSATQTILSMKQEEQLRSALRRLSAPTPDAMEGELSIGEAIDAARSAVMSPPVAALVSVTLMRDDAARYHFLHTLYSQGFRVKGKPLSDDDIAYYLLCRGMEAEVTRLGVAVASLGNPG